MITIAPSGSGINGIESRPTIGCGGPPRLWRAVGINRKIKWAAIKSEGVNLIIEYVKQNPGKHAPYIANAIGIPLKTLERWLKKLKIEGKVKYEASAKTGGYYLVDEKQ